MPRDLNDVIQECAVGLETPAAEVTLLTRALKTGELPIEGVPLAWIELCVAVVEEVEADPEASAETIYGLERLRRLCGVEQHVTATPPWLRTGRAQRLMRTLGFLAYAGWAIWILSQLELGGTFVFLALSFGLVAFSSEHPNGGVRLVGVGLESVLCLMMGMLAIIPGGFTAAFEVNMPVAGGVALGVVTLACGALNFVVAGTRADQLTLNELETLREIADETRDVD